MLKFYQDPVLPGWFVSDNGEGSRRCRKAQAKYWASLGFICGQRAYTQHQCWAGYVARSRAERYARYRELCAQFGIRY